MNEASLSLLNPSARGEEPRKKASGLRICVENSTWNNIGDAFYQWSLMRLMTEAFPEHTVVPGDGPVERAFRLRQKGNAFDARYWQECDLWILSGPILDAWWVHYADFIEHLHRSGRKYALVSLGACAEQSPETLNRFYKFFDRYPPLFATTRDAGTYEYLRPLDIPLHNGVCTAWFAPRYIPHSVLKLERPFFCSSFHRVREPHYQLNASVADFRNLRCDVRPRVLPHRLTRILDSFASKQAEIGPWMIVRPQHGIGLRLSRLQFPEPNALASFNPAAYLAAYAGCDFVITDRIHAAVIGLAQGKPVRLPFRCFRNGIFERFGLDPAKEEFMMPPSSGEITQAHDRLKEFLKLRLS